MTYSADGINYINTTGLFPGMAAGTYNLTAKNSNGCISTATSVTVNAQPATPAAPTASVTSQPTCSVSTGTITITAPTGTGMTYSTDGVTFTNTTGIFTGMVAGSYNVKARNSSGCTSAAASVTVNAQPANPAAPTASVTAQPTCSVSTGTITITAPTGTGMTYSTDGVTYTNTSGIFTGMAPGTYSLTAKNTSGCVSSITSVTVNTQPPSPAAPTASVTSQPTCSVAAGTITITAPTVTGMTYSSDGVTYTNSTGIFTGMAAGTYNLTAKNSSGCTSATTSVTVNAQPATPAAPTASVTAQPTCSVATGTITITAPTGTGMTYSSDGVTYTNTTGIFTGRAAGTYNVTAKNSSGCISAATSVTVNNPPASISGSISGATTICNGSSATLTITATGSGAISGTLSDGTTFSGTAPTVTVAVSPTSTTTYTIATLTNGSCSASPANLTGTAAVVVTAAPSATISYTGSPFCSNTGSATITLAGTTGGSFTISPSGATIDPASGTVNLVSTAPGTYTVTYSVAATSGCSLFAASTQIVVNPNTWTGLVSADWNAAGNWVGTTLTAACPTVTIAAGGSYFPTISSGTVSIQNLVINNGASLTVSGGSLQIGGTITNNGKLYGSAGTLEFNGSSLQTISDSTFYNNDLKNLIISNTSAAGVSLAGPLNILGSVTFTGTGKVLNTNDFLTFKSTASATAWLGNMTGNTLNGRATVERYISAHKGWKFLSIPTNTGQTIQQTWQEGCGANANCISGFGAQITGAGGTAAGFDMYSSTPSMKTFNPATNAWVGVPSTNATVINATSGYMVFVRGDRSVTTTSAAPTSTVLRTKGYIYQGDQPSLSVSPGKFAAIGNPYPSAIDMRNIVKTGLKDFFYLWDPSLAGAYGYGGYQTFSNDGSGNYVVTPGGGDYGPSGGISNYIQSGQAFFVQAGTSGGSITFKEAAKTSGSSMVSTPATLPLPYLRTNLYGINADSSTYMSDGFLINYGDNYSNAVDDNDAIKSANTSENLSSKTANTLLVIERRHTITSKDTIHFNLTGVKVQNYRFEVIAGQLSQPGLTGYLIDNYLHTSTPLNIDGTTLLNFNIANIPASYAADRFEIVFSQFGTLPVTFSSLIAYPQGNTINVQWDVDNEMDIKQYEV
jgi:hypothetical protein